MPGYGPARPGSVLGHGGAELDRLRAEMEELTGKPVQLNMMKYDGPPKKRKEIKIEVDLSGQLDASPPVPPLISVLRSVRAGGGH